MKETGFWFGMGAGLATGMAVGLLLPVGRQCRKTQVGKRLQKMGAAVDHTVDELIGHLR